MESSEKGMLAHQRLGSPAKLGELEGGAAKSSKEIPPKPHRAPEGWERGSGKREGCSLCTTAESCTSIMMAVLSVPFSALGLMQDRSGSLRLTVRLGSSSACSLVSGLLHSCSVRFPVLPWDSSGRGGLPFLALPSRSASPAGTPFVLRRGQGRNRGVRRCRDGRGREYEELRGCSLQVPT